MKITVYNLEGLRFISIKASLIVVLVKLEAIHVPKLVYLMNILVNITN